MTIVEQVADAIEAGLRASDDGAYIKKYEGLTLVDGRFDLNAVATAVLAAVRANLAPRIDHDEEGVLAMLDGRKGSLE